jgi:MFS family permease
MNTAGDGTTSRGKWLALAAALLGWMFDGLEQGLFPLVARPALKDLLSDKQVLPFADVGSVGLLAPLPGASPHSALALLVATEVSDNQVGRWLGLATACFLLGAATGGVLFGWLGDRIGRVRAMTLSVLTYSIFSGLCGLVNSPQEIAVLRFLSALGMGGEWSLGVALVMEIWPDRSRAFLAGMIGAAANVGYLLIGAIGGWLMSHNQGVQESLRAAGLGESQVAWLTGAHLWRLILLLGALPALLTFFIRLFVPESDSWQREQSRGTTSHWSNRDLLGIAVGVVGVLAILYLWGAEEVPLRVRVTGSLAALAVATLGYLYPVFRFLQRSAAAGLSVRAAGGRPIGRMLLGACLGGTALLGTWASMQWAPTWAHKLSAGHPNHPSAAANTQMCSAIGAILGTIGGALLGDRIGRRKTYFLLCAGSLAASQFFFRMNEHVDTLFLISVFVAGGLTASFYGWLPLYLPELFSASMRATGQGFSYNFGRILAAIGALQTGFLMEEVFREDFAKACSIMSLIYVVGMVLIWFAPETRGKRLPD